MNLLDGDTDIPVDVLVPENAEPVLLDAYRQYDVQRASILLSTRPESETLRRLDSIATLVVAALRERWLELTWRSPLAIRNSFASGCTAMYSPTKTT
jgi:hypothetical protein